MNIREIVKHTCANMIAGNTTLIQGPPGFAKTDVTAGVIAPWWKNHNKGKRVGYSTFFMATQTPIGVTGLPWKGTLTHGDKSWTITDPALPEWYIAYCMETGQPLPADQFDTVILVIEEYGQGSAETKRAVAELLRAGGTGKYYLPGHSPVIALSNEDARDGVTKDFDFLIGRRNQITVEGSEEIWREDFAEHPYQWKGRTWRVTPETKVWARQNPLTLFEKRPDKQGPWCNPRSVTMMDRYVQSISQMNGGRAPIDDSGFTTTIAGYIGMPAARSYVTTLQFALDLPTLEQVVANPLDTDVPNKADLQMLMAYSLAANVKPDQLGPVIQYMSKDTKPRMPKDMAITFISSLIRRNYRDFIDLPAMQAWINKNAYLVSAVTAISKA